MPLTMMDEGAASTVKRVGGNDKVRQFLGNLGFSEGADVRMVAKISGNVIVQVKESRIAISKEMAMKISV